MLNSSDTLLRPMLLGGTRNPGQHLNHTRLPSCSTFSRHNGVVIEPVDQDRAKSEAGSDEEGTSPKQKPKSRNGTTSESPSATSHPQGIPHTIPFPPNSHYYRQHTMPAGRVHSRDFLPESSTHKLATRISPTWCHDRSTLSTNWFAHVGNKRELASRRPATVGRQCGLRPRLLPLTPVLSSTNRLAPAAGVRPFIAAQQRPRSQREPKSSEER